MTNQELYQTIIEIQQKDNISRDNFKRYLKNHYLDLYEELMVKTSFLNKFEDPSDKNKIVSIYERLYCLKNELKDRPRCKVCHTEYVCRFIRGDNTYSKWCSARCQASDPECISKSKQTRKNKYGDEKYIGIDKARETRYNKYHGQWSSPDQVKKSKQTKKDRYGDEKYNNIEQMMETKKDRYGDSCYNNHEKISKTKKDRYGDENYNNREKFKETLSSFTEERWEEILNLRINTNEYRYGYKHQLQRPEIKKKIIETVRNNYGVDSVFQLDNVRGVRILNQKIKSWNTILNNGKYTPLFTFDDFKDCITRTTYFNFRCNVCGHIFKSRYAEGRIISRCPECEPGLYRLSQTKVYEFLNHIDSDCEYIQNIRDILNGYEIDIGSKKSKFLIEYDGLIWHTYEPNPRGNTKPKNYHLMKTENCEKQGYTLIHITDDEWIGNEKLCKGMIRSILGKKSYSIYSNKCKIIEVDNETKDKYISKYTFSYTDNSSIRIALTYKNRIVSMITLMKCDDNGKYKILNYIELNNFHIINGFDKMIKYFEQTYTPKELISYLDRRWYNLKTSYLNGFELIETTEPNFWYTDGTVKYNQMIFIDENKAIELCEKYDKSKSILENMNMNGYKRFYDSGTFIFHKKY